MPSLEALITLASAGWDPAVEREIFGTADPPHIARVIEAFVSCRCGPVDDAIFYKPGVGIVAGLRLVGGSDVVVKIHRWNVSVDRLTAVQEVQAYGADLGMPAPRPLVGPEKVAGGIATVEELRSGSRANGRDPAVRRSLAEGLHAFVTTTAPLIGKVNVGRPLMLRPPDAPLWFEPHDLRFDFEGTREGAEWIDDLASLARTRLQDLELNVVLGHFDWRIENLAFKDAEIVAIYDWDSVCSAPEPLVVGVAAAGFTADWTSAEPDPLPTVTEMRAFVHEYEQAMGRAFDPKERDALDAANLSACAYGARCQHSDMSRHPELVRSSAPGWIRLLRERGENGLIEP